MKLDERTTIITDQMNEISESVNDGYANPLTVYITYKKVFEAIKIQMDELKGDAIIELSRHGTGEHIMCGVVASVSNVGGRWDFKSLNDWNKADAAKKEIESKYKAAYKSKQNGIMGVDLDGEIVPLPKYSGSSETIKIKIPKKY
jgi:hypothetical protein